MDYVNYFDKKPLTAFTLGPSGAIPSGERPFKIEWKGWMSGSGFYYQKVSQLGSGTPFVVNNTGFSNATNCSFTFDYSGGLWLSTNEGPIAKIIRPNSSTVIFTGNFSTVFNNAVLDRTRSDTFAFYTKTNDSIYYRTSQDNFVSEKVLASGITNISGISQVAKLDPYFYRYGIFIKTLDGGGKLLTSKRHGPIESGFFRDFENEPTGVVYSLETMGVEGYNGAGYFLNSY